MIASTPYPSIHNHNSAARNEDHLHGGSRYIACILDSIYSIGDRAAHHHRLRPQSRHCARLVLAKQVSVKIGVMKRIIAWFDCDLVRREVADSTLLWCVNPA